MNFGAVHAVAKEGHNKDNTTRGASLRELQRFFEEHDKIKGYAGLRRIPDEDGTALWTTLKDTEVEKQLEERAGERLEVEKGGGMTTLELKSTHVQTEVEEVDSRGVELEDLFKSCGCIPKTWSSKLKKMAAERSTARREATSSAE